MTAGICENCGGKVKIDLLHAKGICEHCGSEYIMETASALYQEILSLLKSGDTQIKIDRYEDAQETFTEITKKYTYEYLGFWGLIRVKSKNLTDFNIDRTTLNELDSLFITAKKVILIHEMEENRDKIIDNINAQYKQYVNQVENNLANFKSDTEHRINTLETESNRKIEDIEEEIRCNEKKKRSFPRPSLIFAIVGPSLFLFPGILTAMVSMTGSSEESGMMLLLTFFIFILSITVVFPIFTSFDTKYIKKVNEQINTLNKKKSDETARFKNAKQALEKELHAKNKIITADEKDVLLHNW